MSCELSHLSARIKRVISVERIPRPPQCSAAQPACKCQQDMRQPLFQDRPRHTSSNPVSGPRSFRMSDDPLGTPFRQTESIGVAGFDSFSRPPGYASDTTHGNGSEHCLNRDDHEAAIRPRGAPRASYHRAGKRLRQTPVRRPGFASCLPELETHDTFWRVRSISLRPILRRVRSWIQKLRP